MPNRRNSDAIMAVLFKTHVIEPKICEAKRSDLMFHLNALQISEATDATFDLLTDNVNVSAFRTIGGDFAEAIPAIGAAQQALISIEKRAHKIRKWGASGDELRALNDWIPIYIAMMGASTHLEMRRASRAAVESTKKQTKRESKKA